MRFTGILGISTALLASSPLFATGVTRVVDDDGLATVASCNAVTAAPTTIQAGVNASNSGDTVLVCPGVYPEQVRIVNKNITVRGTQAAVDKLVLIRPSGSIVQNSNSAYSGDPVGAIIAVEGSTNVVLNNLTVDGSLLTDVQSTVGAGSFIGVFYRNASGSVLNVTARNLQDPTCAGCQYGVGIWAQSGTAAPFAGGANGAPSKLTVQDSSVHDYQKNGIVGTETGTVLTVQRNSVTGIGPTPDIAQNGIQIAFDAKGSIEGNVVANHAWTPCVDVDNCAYASANILVLANGVKVSGNTAVKGQLNVYVEGNNNEVSSNLISDTDVWDGINLIGNNNRALGNVISDSSESGIYIQGNANKVQQKNRINDTPCGVWTEPGSSGTVISGDTTYFNVQATKCSTAPPALLTARSGRGMGTRQAQALR